MNGAVFAPLLRTSLQNPREAAKLVIAMGVPERALWIALALVVVLTSLVMSAVLQAVPLPEDDLGQILAASPLFASPIAATIIRMGQAILAVYLVFWVGRTLGGQGTLQDVLGVITLLQIVSFVLLTGITLVGFVFPLLSSMAFLAFIGWLLWSVITYIDEAHEFENMFKAVGVLFISFIGVIIGMSLLMAVVGGLFLGSTSGV